MKIKIVVFLALLLAIGGSAFAQGIRFDSTTVQEVSTTLITGATNVLTVPSAPQVAFCNFPANAVPCTNKAQTYTTNTLGTPCSLSTQIVLVGTSSCVASPDANGNFGFWAAAGQYAYTITLPGGINLGPYNVTLGIPAGSTITSPTIAGAYSTTGAGTHSGTETFTGALNSNNLAAGNVANKYGTNDAYRYVSSLGSDSNDGLSPGTAFATPQHCNTVVIALGGGTCDARTLYNFTYGNAQGPILVGQHSSSTPTVLLLPQYGTWTCNLTGGTQDCLEVFQGGSVIGTASGVGIQFLIATGVGASVIDVCGTDPSPIGGGQYVRMEGFSCNATGAGSTVSGAVVEIQALQDISKIHDLNAFATITNTKALYAHGLCCSAGLDRVSGSGGNSAGNTPCTFGSVSDNMSGAVIRSVSCTHEGAGKSDVVINQSSGGNAGAHYTDIYAEMDNAGNTTTPVISVLNPSGLVDVIENVHFGADFGVGSTRCLIDIIASAAVIVRNIQQPNATCAINDHSAGRGIVNVGASAIITDYSTPEICCGIAGYFTKPIVFGTLRSSLSISDQGTACTNGELALSAGWQSTGSATVTAVAGNGQTCSWTITTGTTTAANPTITDTLTNPLPNGTTICWMNIYGGTHTAVAGESLRQTTLSATAPVFTANFTPTPGGTSYFVIRGCGP